MPNEADLINIYYLLNYVDGEYYKVARAIEKYVSEMDFQFVILINTLLEHYEINDMKEYIGSAFYEPHIKKILLGE